jgi:DNA-binding SARP family transcriptional activator/TolB-like protein/Flp pilus assembly protein TadD
MRQPKRLALLAYLAVARPHGLQRRDKVISIFWPELDDRHARNALSQALHVLRASLGDGAIVTRGEDEIGICEPLVTSDVTAFERAVDTVQLEAAFGLYRGDFLDGLNISGAPEFERWLDAERQRLRERASELGWALAREKRRAGDVLVASRLARAATTLLLPDEAQIRRLITFLFELGDHAAAARAYDEFARQLAKDYELEPSIETQQLARSVRESVRAPMAAAQPITHSEPPSTPPNGRGSVETRRSPRRIAGVAAVTALAVVMVVASIVAWRSRGRARELAPARRLVVHQLVNIGAPENAYFAAGIGDEIATRLAVVRRLLVLAGPTAQRYAAATGTARDSSRTGMVDYFLEGSVSWLPMSSGRGHLRARLQLVSARDGHELWGDVFDEDVLTAKDLFELYSRIAQRVVGELDLVLESPSSRTPPPPLPTRSLEAYDDYLRGRNYLKRTATTINFAAAIQAFSRAVQRDTQFAAAYAMLSAAHSEGVWVGGMERTHLPLAKAAAERALALDSLLPEAHMFLGHYYYVCCADYDRAITHLMRARALGPADAEAPMRIGLIYKRQGRWSESLPMFEAAEHLDPLWRWPPNNIGHAQMWARRYDDAERTFRRVIATEPQDVFAYAHLAYVLVLRDGNVDAALRIIGEAQRSSDNFAYTRMPFYLALLERNYARALVTLTSPEPGLIDSYLNEWLVDDEIRRGLVERLKGDSVAARRQFDAAVVELEATRREQSADGPRAQLWLRSGLAIAYAALGRRDEAKRQIVFVDSTDPLKVDAIEGPKYLMHVALADMLLGDREAAIDVLARVLSVGAPVSIQSLRLEPFWDPLRSNPRFVRLTQTVY